MRHIRHGALGLLLAVCLAVPLAGHGETPARIYTFGVVPQFDARRLHAVWQPLLDAVQTRTGLQFRMLGAPTIPAFEKEFLHGRFDFAYMNPYHVLLANQAVGYIPLVRDRGRRLQGILVTRKDSRLDRIEALAGKVIAFPSPNALGASLMLRAMLADRYRLDYQPRYVQTHSSVYLNVALGQAAAGGGVQKTLEQQPAAVRDRLQIIYRTPGIVPHPLCAHPRVPAAIRRQVRTALLELGQTQAGRALLARIPIRQIGPARMADYAPLAKLQLERFYVGE